MFWHIGDSIYFRWKRVDTMLINPMTQIFNNKKIFYKNQEEVGMTDEAIKSTETRIDDEAIKSTETRMHYM